MRASSPSESHEDLSDRPPAHKTNVEDLNLRAVSGLQQHFITGPI